MLPGMTIAARRRAAGGGLQVEHTFSDFVSASPIAAGNQTFSDVPLGAASATRVIAVGVAAFNQFSDIVSVTVGGETAVLSVSQFAGNALRTSWWVAEVPTGSTGNVVVNLPATTFTCHVHVFRLDGLLGVVPTDTATGAASTTTTASASIDVEEGGVALALAFFQNTDAGSSLGGVTTEGDETSITDRSIAGFSVFPAGATGHSLTAVPGSSTHKSITAIAMR